MRIELPTAPLPAPRRPRVEALPAPRLDPMAGLIAALTRPDLFRIVETADGITIEPVEGSGGAGLLM